MIHKPLQCACSKGLQPNKMLFSLSTAILFATALPFVGVLISH